MKAAADIVDPEVRVLAERARSFVSGFEWCHDVTSCALAFAISGVLGVFRVELHPKGDADSTVWVVVGDLPPAYLAYEDGDHWQDALGGYVAEMQTWVDAANAGEGITRLIPVNVPPTRDNAQKLASRLEFIRRNLLDVNPASLEGDA